MPLDQLLVSPSTPKKTHNGPMVSLFGLCNSFQTDEYEFDYVTAVLTSLHICFFNILAYFIMSVRFCLMDVLTLQVSLGSDY